MAHIAEMCEWRKETLVSNIHHAIRIVFGALILPIYGSIPKLLRRHRKAKPAGVNGDGFRNGRSKAELVRDIRILIFCKHSNLA